MAAMEFVADGIISSCTPLVLVGMALACTTTKRFGKSLEFGGTIIWVSGRATRLT